MPYPISIHIYDDTDIAVCHCHKGRSNELDPEKLH